MLHCNSVSVAFSHYDTAISNMYTVVVDCDHTWNEVSLCYRYIMLLLLSTVESTCSDYSTHRINSTQLHIVAASCNKVFPVLFCVSETAPIKLVSKAFYMQIGFLNAPRPLFTLPTYVVVFTTNTVNISSSLMLLRMLQV